MVCVGVASIRVPSPMFSVLIALLPKLPNRMRKDRLGPIHKPQNLRTYMNLLVSRKKGHRNCRSVGRSTKPRPAPRSNFPACSDRSC